MRSVFEVVGVWSGGAWLAERLARDGIEVEVIDPRTLRPFDRGAVAESLRRTHRLVVVHEAPVFGGFGAEIVAAHQICLNFSSLVFMVPLSFANAITVRVGWAIGQQDLRQARYSSYSGIAFVANYNDCNRASIICPEL